MSPPNGHANGSFGNSDQHSTPSILSLNANSVTHYTPEQIKEFVALLEVPFDPAVIEWRVTNTSKGNGQSRGQVIPYADQRAYTDRLNVLFSPAGWTRRYTVHTSANFQRAKDQKTTAKVFVTCDLTIFGLGSHSATGEEWADDKMRERARKHRRSRELAPVLDSADISTISRESGLTWTTANARKQFQSWQAGRHLMAGGKDCALSDSPIRSDPPQAPPPAAKLTRTDRVRANVVNWFGRSRAWQNYWAEAYIEAS